mmetsp:Transcript_20344/g.44425  ORF Transcript_20344/g.44425 Transcript_20344/m.44425 type:complete len:203 (-) Transcript_20344:381-989(-)
MSRCRDTAATATARGRSVGNITLPRVGHAERMIERGAGAAFFLAAITTCRSGNTTSGITGLDGGFTLHQLRQCLIPLLPIVVVSTHLLIPGLGLLQQLLGSSVRAHLVATDLGAGCTGRRLLHALLRHPLGRSSLLARYDGGEHIPAIILLFSFVVVVSTTAAIVVCICSCIERLRIRQRPCTANGGGYPLRGLVARSGVWS